MLYQTLQDDPVAQPHLPTSLSTSSASSTSSHSNRVANEPMGKQKWAMYLNPVFCDLLDDTLEDYKPFLPQHLQPEQYDDVVVQILDRYLEMFGDNLEYLPDEEHVYYTQEFIIAALNEHYDDGG